MSSDLQTKTFCKIHAFFYEDIHHTEVQENFDQLAVLFNTPILEPIRLSTLVHEGLCCLGLELSAYLTQDQQRQFELILLELSHDIEATESPLILLSQKLEFSPYHWHSNIDIVSADHHLGPSYGGNEMEAPIEEMMARCWGWAQSTYKGNIALKLKEGALQLQAQDRRNDLQRETIHPCGVSRRARL